MIPDCKNVIVNLKSALTVVSSINNNNNNKVYFRPTTENSEGPYSKYNRIKYRYIIQTIKYASGSEFSFLSMSSNGEKLDALTHAWYFSYMAVLLISDFDH